MKTTKLFFALAIAAGLAACTKEVLVEPEKAIDSFDEIKGAKVLANGFSVELDPEAETKVAVEGGVPKFVENDKAGIAWFVANGKVDGVQEGAAQSDLYATAYANHKLNHDGSRFNSNSNVFEGWHVAYFPYKEMRKPDWLTFTVNPEMKVKPTTDDEYAKEQFENSVMFSAAHFVGVDDVDDGLIKTPMKLQFVANAIRPKFTLDPNFKAAEIKNQKIVSVTLSAGKKALFAETLTVNPSKFPAEDDTFNKTHFGPNDQALVRPYAALQARPGYVTSVTTTVAEDEDLQNQYTVGSENLNFRMFLAPVPAAVAETVTASDLTITVALENGNSFVLSGKTPSTDNNEYRFDRLAGYLNGTNKNSEGLSLQDIILDAKGQLQFISFPFDLTAADYKYTPRAESIEQWREQVALAKAMGATELEIGLPKNSTIEFPEGDMYTEGLAITVKAATGGAKLVFAEETNWSDNITLSKNVSVEVEETGVLTVGENGLTSKANITNAGTIVLLDGADLTAKAITNDGTIEVSVGSEIVAPTGAGKVVYTVDETVTTDKIDALIANASLNTLVVNADLTSATALDWSDLTVEMNGAVLTADVTADAINVNEGENAINGNITASVTVAEDASLSVDGNINGGVTVDGTADFNSTVINGALTINGDVTLAAEPYDVMNVTSITNKGDLVANTNVYVQEVYTKLGSTTNTIVNGVYTIYYVETFPYENNGGTVTGYIKPYTPVNPALGYQKFDGTYFVKNDTGIANVLALNEANIDVVLESNVAIDVNAALGGDATTAINIDANGSTITFNQDGDIPYDENVAGGEYIHTANPEAVLTIYNGNISKTGTTSVDQFNHNILFSTKVVMNNVNSDRAFNFMADAELNNVTIADPNDVYAIWIQPVGQAVILNNCHVLATNGAGIKIEESRTDGTLAKPTLEVSNTEFKTAEKAAIVVNAAVGADITLNNVTITETGDPINAVWIDEAMKDGSYFTNVTVTGGSKTVEP